MSLDEPQTLAWDVVALKRAGAHFPERAAAFPKQLCATATRESKSRKWRAHCEGPERSNAATRNRPSLGLKASEPFGRCFDTRRIRSFSIRFPWMTRHVLIRGEDDVPRVVAEAALPTEAELHDALTKHPRLIPMSDLGFGDAVVVGKESGLASGYADLVLVDDRGRVCIVEVKNEGNPDTRRVVAQLLDYAASLWNLSVDEFEQRVVHPFLNVSGTDPMPVGEYVAEATERGSSGADDLTDQLAQTLESGDFALVVVAPKIPVGVQRVLEYLNARGQRLYGLEVSYFRGPVECFVPRLVVKPLTSDPAGEAASGSTLDEEALLAQVPEQAREALAAFLSSVMNAGADVVWRKYGASITVTRGQQRQVAYLDAKRLGVVLKASGDFPQEPFDDVRHRLAELGVGVETKDGWYRNVSLGETSIANLRLILDAAHSVVDALVPAMAFSAVSPAIELTFTRNDHNLWTRHAPALEPLQGRHLRGKLTDTASGADADVHLVPLANRQPGWRPRFTPASARHALWPAGAAGGDFRLRVDEASS